MESFTPITGKPRRDKITNKGQQDEEEERGILNIKFNIYLFN
jgi:hypothetical protein